MSHPFQTIEACSLMDPLPRSVVSLLHGEVRPTCSANGQKVAIIGTLTQYGRSLKQIFLKDSSLICPLFFNGPPTIVGEWGGDQI